MTLKCRSYAAAQWFSALPEASSILLGTPAVETSSSGEGRGLGLFATRSVPAFSQILADAPLILMKPNEDLPELYQQFKGQSKEQQETYLGLSYHENPARDAILKDKLLRRGFGEEGLEEMSKVAGIMMTNAFNVDLQDGRGSSHRALFPNVARINHSCAPNAHVSFHPRSEQSSRGRMVIHTLKDLQPGEEVVIAYFNLLLPRSERQEKAKKWEFDCRCVVCDECSPDHEQLEEQRKAFRDFTKRQVNLMQSGTSTLKSINGLIDLGRSIAAESEDCPELIPALPDLCDGLGMLQSKALVIQKLEAQRRGVLEYFEKSVTWEARITGKDSPATKRRLQKLIQFAARKGSSSQPWLDLDRSGRYVLVWPDD